MSGKIENGVLQDVCVCVCVCDTFVQFIIMIIKQGYEPDLICHSNEQ